MVLAGPRRLAFPGARDATLLLFCATTYAVLTTIVSFGWLLLAMGVAQSAPEQRKTLGAYVAVFGLLLIYREVPWLSWL